MIVLVVLFVSVILLVGYLVYGRFLAKEFQLDDSRVTPSREFADGVDYVPAKSGMLLGQHFSAIAAAGPIVGPILAGLWFGWVPALLWIIFGAIFVGGVHDFSSLIASIRHKGSSIGEIIKQHMSSTSYVLFLSFVWLTLVYIIIAFTDITAHTFKAVVADEAFGPGVAVSSFLYLLLAFLMGILLYRFKLNLKVATAIFLPLVFLVIWVGGRLPQSIISFLGGISIKSWEVILLAYCFIASLIPVWLLLQPRGYLGGWFLYLTMFVAFVGAVFGGFEIKYPALNLDGLKSLENGKLIFPILFITVACGACSGFHGIVSSGTTSKQVYKESDTKLIGYGAMLLEGLVAVLALATLMMLPKTDSILKSDPNIIYASGLANYMSLFGINFALALSFSLLAFSTFVYDTLDVSTRLGRYILQELLGWKTKTGAYFSALITLLVPFIFLLLSKEKAYLVAWPIFGTSNQLLASLILLAVSVWLIRTGKNPVYTLLPMAFMMAMTLWSLVLQFLPFLRALRDMSEIFKLGPDRLISGVCGIVLFILSGWLILEALYILALKKGSKK